jgi:hypothetical protein
MESILKKNEKTLLHHSNWKICMASCLTMMKSEMARKRELTKPSTKNLEISFLFYTFAMAIMTHNYKREHCATIN